MSIFSTIGKVAQGLLNPMGTVIDLAGSALGLPDGVKNIAKVGLGAVTGNFAAVADGAIGLASSALKGEGKTEYRASSGAQGANGYAPSAAGVANPDGKLRDVVSTLQLFFREVDPLGNPVSRGTLNKGDLLNAARSTKVPPEVREAARYLLDHPAARDLLDQAKTGKVDGLISMADLETVLRQLDAQKPQQGGGNSSPISGHGPCRKTEAPAAEKHCGPVSKPTPPSKPTKPSGPQKPGGGHCAPAPKPSEPGCGGSGKVGGTRQERTHCAPPDSCKSILNNPRLSTEEKIQAILAQIADNTDAEILNVMEEMSDLSSRKGGMSKEDSAKADGSMEQLQLRLQKLTEQRKQMFTLMSNISEKYNEMSNHAIQNLGKA
jgi:hypothetical protein